MSVIVIPSTQLFLFVTPTYRLTNFPSTGTYISIEKDTEDSVPMSGQHNTLTHVENNDDLHRMTVTLMQGHEDDAFMMAALAGQRALAAVFPVSLTYFGVNYSSVNCRISKKATREIAADSIPNVVYVLAGTFPGIAVASFAQPTSMSEADVASFLP